MACTHDHSCEDHNCAVEWSLYKHINLPKVTALNESVTGSVKSIFKAWDHRLDNSEGFLESNEGDSELLVFIPFTTDVKIKSISVVGGSGGTSPSKMRAQRQARRRFTLLLPHLVTRLTRAFKGEGDDGTS